MILLLYEFFSTKPIINTISPFGSLACLRARLTEQKIKKNALMKNFKNAILKKKIHRFVLLYFENSIYAAEIL